MKVIRIHLVRITYESERDSFIETYLNNESLSVDQKEYLLSCLESGMSMKEIENIFSEKLSVDQMKRLNAIVQNRRNKK